MKAGRGKLDFQFKRTRLLPFILFTVLYVNGPVLI
jgi:hypothetical protein